MGCGGGGGGGGGVGGGGAYIAQYPCNSIAIVWAKQAGGGNERMIDSCIKVLSKRKSCEGQYELPCLSTYRWLYTNKFVYV